MLNLNLFSGDTTPGFRADVIPFELLQWNRQLLPTKAPVGHDDGSWDCHGIYAPVAVRNLDRTLYRDGDGNMVVFYIGNNNFTGNDFDQSGFYKGPDLNNLTKISVSAPFVPLGASGDPDSTDAQVTSVWWDGSQFVIYYNGNSGTGNDNVNACLATSPDLVTLNKEGIIIQHGDPGDAYSLYDPKLIPSDADGKPRIIYFGRTADPATFGLMAAVSSGGITGPYTKISTVQLFSDGETDVGDAWYDPDRKLYVVIYSPLFSIDPGICLATSYDGFNWTKRDSIYGVGVSPAWDIRAYNAQTFKDGGTNYLLFNSNEDIGWGYASV